MIQLTAQPTPGLSDVLRTAGPAPTMTSGFAVALSGVMALAVGPADPAPGGLAAFTDRQADAGGGKALPLDAAPAVPASASSPFAAVLQAPDLPAISAEQVPLLSTTVAAPDLRPATSLEQPLPVASKPAGRLPQPSPTLVATGGASSIENEPPPGREAASRVREKGRKNPGEDAPVAPDAPILSWGATDPAPAAVTPLPTSHASLDAIPYQDARPPAPPLPVVPIPDSLPMPTATQSPAVLLAPLIPAPVRLRADLREPQPVSTVASLAAPAEAASQVPRLEQSPSEAAPPAAAPPPSAQRAASHVVQGAGTSPAGRPPSESGPPEATPAQTSHVSSTIDAVAARLAVAALPPGSTAPSGPTIQTAVTIAQPAAAQTPQVLAVPRLAPAAPVQEAASDPHFDTVPVAARSSAASPAEAPAGRPVVAADPSTRAQPAVAREPVAIALQPAAHAFAAAMFAASDRHAPRRGDAAAELAAAFPLAGLGGSVPASPVTVQPVVAPHAPPLDARTDEWIGAMIERIETLRDEGAGVRETRIRLTPDALGTLDVAIRQEGDAVSVRIAAETPAARALLAEAAPRLTDLAEARGLKLAGAGIEGGGAGGGSTFADRQPSRQTDAPLPARPRAAGEGEDAPTTDTRIA